MNKLKLTTIITLGIIVSLIFLAFLKQNKISSNRTKQTVKTNHVNNRLLTAGGSPIPLQFQAKSKGLGYYCPSWDNNSGSAQPGACVKLDK